MSARFSDRAGALGRARRLLPTLARNERGGILVITAIMLIALLATGGLAVDLGQVYITRSKLSSVADAGALAGARIVRLGQTRARSAVMSMAAANGLVTGTAGADITVGFAIDAKGRQTVSVAVSRPQKLMFAGLVGFNEIPVRATATATGPPLDLVMVIDQSGSLADANAWDDVQYAAKQFVGFFSDGYDKVALVSFQTIGAMRNTLSYTFKSSLQYSINRMSSFGSTNMAEGLRMARDELKSTRIQANSLKAVVFFTDGFPNTFRGTYNGNDLAVGIHTTGATPTETVAHYLKNPLTQPVDYNVPWLADCNGDPRKSTTVCPNSWTPQYVVDRSRADALAMANDMRAAGVYVYTIGMKDTKVVQDPDMAFLKLMANENGRANPGQPQAKAYYAPSGAQLQEIFTQVASDIMVHLVQ
jgi:Flp pilus assembly protein TadG